MGYSIISYPGGTFLLVTKVISPKTRHGNTLKSSNTTPTPYEHYKDTKHPLPEEKSHRSLAATHFNGPAQIGLLYIYEELMIWDGQSTTCLGG